MQVQHVYALRIFISTFGIVQLIYIWELFPSEPHLTFLVSCVSQASATGVTLTIGDGINIKDAVQYEGTLTLSQWSSVNGVCVSQLKLTPETTPTRRVQSGFVNILMCRVDAQHLFTNLFTLF